MKRISSILFLILLLTGFSGFAEGFRLPREAEITLNSAPDGQTWEQCGTIGLTYASARKNFDWMLRRQGWVRIKTVEFDRVRWKSLELWSKGKEKLLIQYWRMEVSLTGFAWGRLKNGEKS